MFLQLGRTHAVPDADQRLWHLVALLVDQGRQIPRVVPPASCSSPPGQHALSWYSPESRPEGWMHTVIAHYLLIQHARLALIPHVGDPDGPDADPVLGGAHVKFIPQRLIQFLPTVRT